jgi:hypothetical protein
VVGSRHFPLERLEVADRSRGRHRSPAEGHHVNDSEPSTRLDPNRVFLLLIAFLLQVSITIAAWDGISFHSNRLARAGITYAGTLSLLPLAGLAVGLSLWTRAVRLDSIRLLAVSVAVPAVVSLGVAAIVIPWSNSIVPPVESSRSSAAP